MAKIKEEVERLESLLKNTSNTNNLRDEVINTVVDNNDELEPQPLFIADFNKDQEECEKEARSMILKAIRHIFSREQVKTTEYLKDKLKLDVTSLGGMLYQNKCAILMQKTLMEEIGRGAASPRHFEVFSGLTKTIADNNRQLLQTVEAIKSTYIGIRSDIYEKQQLQITSNEASSSKMIEENTQSSGITANGGYSGNSPKDLIREMQRIAKEAKINAFDDAEEIN
ncbi:MAG: hypothetical protein RSE41_06865 [Clostridia bacterium]